MRGNADSVHDRPWITHIRICARSNVTRRLYRLSLSIDVIHDELDGKTMLMNSETATTPHDGQWLNNAQIYTYVVQLRRETGVEREREERW